MSADVLRIVPNNALCVDPAEIAERLERLAARIRAGEFEGIERAVVLIDAAADCHFLYGRPTTHAYLVGLLEYAKLDVMRPAGA